MTPYVLCPPPQLCLFIFEPRRIRIIELKSAAMHSYTLMEVLSSLYHLNHTIGQAEVKYSFQHRIESNRIESILSLYHLSDI